MTHIVYGLRLKGDTEPRYIGQTGKSPAERLRFLSYCARKMPIRSPFSNWLRENGDAVEAFAIFHCADEAEARKLERDTVRFCLALGHRLFNLQLVPVAQRICKPASMLDAQAAA